VSIEAVTFDYWNTLCVVDTSASAQRRRAAWRATAADLGLDVDAAVIDAVLAHISERHHAGWVANEQFTAERAIEEAMMLLAEHGADAHRAVFTDAWLTACRGADVRLTEGLPEVLAALHDAGVRIGIVCDVGLTPSVVLREFLDQRGVLRYFDHWSFSDDVGVYKPHERIFRHALDGLGVDDPADALHVGDLRRTDIAGAQALGMTAVRYRGVADDVDDPDGIEGDHVIDELHELIEVALGAGRA
jgi:putative hydrolase of the HAD superfamily